MNDMLPKLFFVHFRETSFVAISKEEIVGFLIGFLSQTFPDQAYIHFVGIHPDFRKRGLASNLYEHFMSVARKKGCRVVRCITSPVNKGSIAYHTRIGFTIEPGDIEVDGFSVAKGYDGQGGDRVLFVKSLR